MSILALLAQRICIHPMNMATAADRIQWATPQASAAQWATPQASAAQWATPQSGAPTATRMRDLPLRRSFNGRLSTAIFLVRADLLIVWLQLNVSGSRPLLARSWHEHAPRWELVGVALLDVARRPAWARYAHRL